MEITRTSPDYRRQTQVDNSGYNRFIKHRTANDESAEPEQAQSRFSAVSQGIFAGLKPQTLPVRPAKRAAQSTTSTQSGISIYKRNNDYFSNNRNTTKSTQYPEYGSLSISSNNLQNSLSASVKSQGKLSSFVKDGLKQYSIMEKGSQPQFSILSKSNKPAGIF